jgi:putative transposase
MSLLQGGFSPMSIQFSQGKLQDEERKTILQQVQSHMQKVAQEAVRGVVTEVMEKEVTVKLGREKGQPRVANGQARGIDWGCRNCGCSDANQFIRDGHYRRELQTGWGTVQDLQVPMLECQRCKHDVICEYAILEKYKRFWMDLAQDALWSSGCSQSLRDICDRWSATVGHSVGLRTINERINQIEPLAHQFHNEPFKQVPEVIQLDGIWVTVTTEGEVVLRDRRNRARHQREGKKRVILVALGFWTENGKEKREIVDWQIAQSEKHEEWEVLLHRLLKRGAKADNGLKAIIRDGCGGLGRAVELVYAHSVIDQRCIFHKLKNVRDKCRTELKGDDHQEQRRQALQEAKAVYQAESAEQAQERLAVWSMRWGGMAPESVATFERDFDATIAFYQLEALPLQWVRSTSLLERVNRQLRRKFRQALSFGSEVGAEVALYLQVQRLHSQWNHTSWWHTSHALSFDLQQVQHP